MTDYAGPDTEPEPLHMRDHWGLAHRFMRQYIDLLEERHGDDGYLFAVYKILKKKFYQAEEFLRQWKGLGKQQRIVLMESIMTGSRALFTEEEVKSTKHTTEYMRKSLHHLTDGFLDDAITELD